MINYSLPTEIIIDGVIYPINKNGDYRMILDVVSALNDETLSEQDKVRTSLCIFYDFNIPPDTQKAVDEMMLFINCGEADEQKKQDAPIMNWEQDFPLLVSPINRTLGYEIRSASYLHWWTFISGYMEIGECQFATVVNIRQKKRKGKKLDSWEQEYYAKNKKKVDLNVKFDKVEQEFMHDLFGVE